MKTSRKCLWTAILLIYLLSGCSPVVKDEDVPEEFNLYASFYPIYALSGLIVDDSIPGMRLHQLVQPQDGCIRNYVLSDWDAYLLSSADAVILGGSGLESFEGAFASIENGPAVVSAMSSLVLENGGDEPDAEEEQSHFTGPNPWLFLSADGGAQIAESICAAMIELDPGYAEKYAGNLEKALERFEKLKTDRKEMLSGANLETPCALLHEGLIYTSKELGMNAVAQIERESGGMPDEQELDEMMNRLKQSGAKAVLIEKQAPEVLIEVLSEAGFRIALIDTLTAIPASAGSEAYFEKMLENAKSIANALSE